MKLETDPDSLLRQRGIELPLPLQPAGNYIPVRQVGKLLFLSGMGPTNAPHDIRVTGKVGLDISLTEARYAACLTCLNTLSALSCHLDGLSGVAGFVKVNGFVNCAPGFIDLPPIVDGFSKLVNELWPGSTGHARSAVGVAELPFDIAVEIECIAELH